MLYIFNELNAFNDDFLHTFQHLATSLLTNFMNSYSNNVYQSDGFGIFWFLKFTFFEMWNVFMWCMWHMLIEHYWNAVVVLFVWLLMLTL